MSELLNQTMRPDLYEKLPIDLKIMQNGLEQMSRHCEELTNERDEARRAAREYRDKYCATIITKHEKLDWEA